MACTLSACAGAAAPSATPTLEPAPATSAPATPAPSDTPPPTAAPAPSVTASAEPSQPAATPPARTQTVPPTAIPLIGIPRYGIFEQTFNWDSSGYSNPWEQVSVSMKLTAPGGQSASVDGFYFAPNVWKARFAPGQTGDWSWQAVIADGNKNSQYSGRFTVVESALPGFMRANPQNKFRWVTDNGASINPLGIGDCIMDRNHAGTPLDHWGFDGGFRKPGQEIGSQADSDTYFKAYSDAGVNLFRWSVDNCAFNLFQKIDSGGNVYLEREGSWGDQLVQKLRQYGVHTEMVIFGNHPTGIDLAAHLNPHQTPAAPAHAGAPAAGALDAVKRYVAYVVNRYGAYVDIWELMNEANAPDPWYAEIAQYIRQIDPYHHPISTSWEKPNLPAIDINSPHWYQKEGEFISDQITWLKIQDWKSAGKPVIVGEQGNEGQNWDERSGLRMRLRTWTAFFAEGVLIFWNSSGFKDYRNGSAANIYLGPEERGYLKTLQDFTRGFDPRSSIAALQISDPNAVRGYALTAPTAYLAYLHAYTNHASATTGIRVTIEPQAAGSATWIEPSSGRVLGTQDVPAGRQTLAVPAFVTDIALKVAR